MGLSTTFGQGTCQNLWRQTDGKRMSLTEQLEAFFQNLLALDLKKKIALGALILMSLLVAVFISVQFGKPATTPLYSDLSREDLNSMSRILSENGMEFLINRDTGSIEVTTAKTAHARMLLAEHGLPSSQESGYELFDRVNTLGLTSFMQGVTNKRAIEGELVRTIQMINGVNSARVHLVMEEKNVFRRNRGAPPSASVVLKTFGKIPVRSINAIRHMVAAAVPGLDASNVTIIGSDGTLMTSKDDLAGGSAKLVDLEKEFERNTEAKILATLGAHLGNENLRVSVTAKLNKDKTQVSERVFDPESRVERSVQIVREAGTTENRESALPATVDQNLPDEEVGEGAGQSSLENSERREELTNYEINEKQISVVSDGYKVEQLSVAIVVNKSRLEQLLEDNPTQEQIDAKAEELRAIAEAAVSFSEERGDKIMVNLVEFVPVGDLGEEVGSSPILSFFAMHFGAILNVLGLILGILLFAFLGVRPLLSILNKENAPAPALGSGLDDMVQLDSGMAGEAPMLPPLGNGGSDFSPESLAGDFDTTGVDEGEWQAELDDIANREAQLKDRLGEFVSQGEQRAASIIKNWLQETERV